MTDWIDVENPALALAIRLGLIVLTGLIAMAAVRLFANQMGRRLDLAPLSTERRARLKTLLMAGRSVANILAGITVLLMILNQFDINVAPILASAGIAGLALSLGSQTFIKDIFAGVVLLVESQFAVGDMIKVGEVTGSVERITLRATYLRDLEGRRISIPNGDIRTIANVSTEWSRAVVILGLPREADIEPALAALRRATADVQADPAARQILLEAPQVEGWVDLTDTSVQVRLTAKTQPGRQAEVAQSMRKHALYRLNQAGAHVGEDKESE